MKKENLDKMKEALMDEFKVSESTASKLAEYCVNAVASAITHVIDKMFCEGKEEKGEK